MILSETHRYLFIEIPLTASWAVHHELVSNYAGTSILHKHATYPEFKKYCGKRASEFFVFACVRNPLDEIVSRYFKLISDHKGVFSNPSSADQLISETVDRTKYEFVKDPDITFEDYFRKFHRRPFGGLIDVSSGRFDYVIRFEDLQTGFTEVLERLHLNQVRPIPITNKTQGRDVNWQCYYPQEIRRQALQICGPFMSKWGYEYPPEWGAFHLHPWNNLKYRMYNVLRTVYFTQFRYKDTTFAKFVRQFRSKLN